MAHPRPHAPRWWDVAGAVALAALLAAGTRQIGRVDEGRTVDALAYACAVAGALSLALWRRWMVAMLAVVVVTGVVYTWRDYPGGPALLPGPLAIAFAGFAASRRAAWVAAAAVSVALVAPRAMQGDVFGAHELIVFGWTFAAVLAGQMLKTRIERRSEARAHATQQVLADERLRIARDLHDSVAHAMATINVQSGVAAHLLERRPEQAHDALEAIRAASRDALDELGAILGVLRQGDGAAPLAPTAHLADVDGLLQRARADGLVVHRRDDADGALDRVTPSISAAAYRVVQEALTNVRRHAGAGAQATLAVEVDGRALEVRVDDAGPPGAAPVTDGPGFGLLGMRERVEATGGTFTAGPRAADGPSAAPGWQVRAHWPTAVRPS